VRTRDCWLRWAWGVALLTCWTVGWTNSSTQQLLRRVEATDSNETAQKVIKDSPLVRPEDQALKENAENMDREEIVRALRLRVRAEGNLNSALPPEADAPSAASRAQELKKKKFIRDPEGGSSNWLGRVAERIAELFRREQRPRPRREIPEFGWLSGLFYGLMWTLLGVAVLAFLWIVFTRFRWVFGWKKKIKASGGILEDDEPMRTEDEWVLEAERLYAEGKPREAIRALYLAILVRLDDAGVARLIRTETNWEHEHRVRLSPTRPPSLDIREATRRFDWVWYGYRLRVPEDWEFFNAEYQKVIQLLKERAA